MKFNICGPGRTAVEPALRRYLREWRERNPEEVRQRLTEAAAEHAEPQTPFQVADRLTADGEQAIVDAFMAGTPKWQLAERHGVSMSSVKRLLRRHRATRRHRNGRAD
jgi:DNA-directed RNA polymerase specialized sigma24 family protein